MNDRWEEEYDTFIKKDPYEYDRFSGNCPTCGQEFLKEKAAMNTDKAQTEWEKEHRPEHWLEYTWAGIQRKMAEVAEFLEAHPEIETNILGEEYNEDSKPNA